MREKRILTGLLFASIFCYPVTKMPVFPVGHAFAWTGGFMRHLILGSGIAGLQAARAISSLQAESEIIMLGREADPPYARPMISHLLEGVVQPVHLDLGLPPGVSLHSGDEAVAVHPLEKTVLTREGRKLTYDRLLVATGADPRGIQAENTHLENIHFMRSKAQVQSMLQALPRSRRALVLGGGLVGFKAAYGLLRQGLEVTMLIRSGYPLSQQVDAAAGEIIRDKLQEKGLRVLVGRDAVRFEADGSGAVRRAELSDGSELDCDLVVIGKGVLPATGFLKDSGVDVDLGVLVDERMRTSVPDVYAAGDVAEHVDLARDRRWVNAIWPEAADQGRIAGLNMAGVGARYPGSLSRNTIRIFDMDLATCGLVNPPEDAGFEILEDSDARQGTYRRLVFFGKRLVGATCINRVEHAGLLRALISSRTPVPCPREELLRTDIQPGGLLPSPV
jgi:NAD(P)H-nitrite reductase large subunit